MTADHSKLNVLSIGGSRNIGYYSAIRLLEKGATVTFLLRKPDIFKSDETIQKYVQSGHARLIKGDALVKADVENAWHAAANAEQETPVDVLIFTVGGEPKFEFKRGFIVEPANLVTQCILNALSTMPFREGNTKVITLSSTGLTKASHKKLPLVMKPLYGWALKVPHKDKIGMERLITHCAGWEWDVAGEGEVGEEVLPKGWQETQGLPAPGKLTNVLVIRAALLTDGDSQADKKGKAAYRVQEGDMTGYTISRKDTAHFIVEEALPNWEKWGGKVATIAY